MNKHRIYSKGFTDRGICIFLWLVIFSLGFSAYASGYMLSVGHLPPLRGGNTFLSITDLNGSGPEIKISFYDELGREVTASPVHKLLPPRGKVQIDVESYLQTAGTIILESSNDDIMGEYWQINGNDSMLMLPFQRPGAEGRFFVNCFRLPSCNHNYLVISDPRGYGPLVQMEFYNRSGELIKIAKKLIRPHGTLAFKVDAYAPWDTLGKVSVRSFGGGIGLHYRQLCRNDAVVAVPARLPAEQLFINTFSTSSDISGNLVIADASAEGPATKIQFRDGGGAILYELEKLLPPNGTVLIDPTDYASDNLIGTIAISSESEIIADYWEKAAESIINIPAIDKAGETLFVSYFSPFDGVQNSLSMLNVGKELTKVKVSIYSDSGQEVRTKELFLEPYKRFEELLDSYFAGKRVGTVIIRSSGADLAVTSHIFELQSQRLLGKVNAQVIR